jgi:hypothetical protein
LNINTKGLDIKELHFLHYTLYIHKVCVRGVFLFWCCIDGGTVTGTYSTTGTCTDRYRNGHTHCFAQVLRSLLLQSCANACRF